jgi:hypothetical protein
VQAAAELVPILPFESDLWKPQNVCYDLLQTVYPAAREQAVQGDPEAQTWLEHFRTLGEKLLMRVG